MIQAKTVEEIISKYNKARGTAGQFSKVISVRMEGTREMLGRSFPVVVTKVQNRLSRIDFEIADGKGYTIVTSTMGWSYIPIESSHAEPIPAETLTELLDELDIAGPTLDYENKRIKINLDGKEEVNGMMAYKIRIIYPSGKSLIYLIDKQTNLLVQTRWPSNNKITGTAEELVTNFSDYKSVDGILFPFRISNASMGPMAGVMTFTKIEVNVAVPDHLYRPDT